MLKVTRPMTVPRRMELAQIPKSKIQNPNKSQIPNGKSENPRTKNQDPEKIQEPRSKHSKRKQKPISNRRGHFEIERLGYRQSFGWENIVISSGLLIYNSDDHPAHGTFIISNSFSSGHPVRGNNDA